MRHRPAPHIADRVVAALRRRAIVWLLLLVLPVHGLSAALIGLLGQNHFHAAVPSHALGRALWQPSDDAASDAALHDHAHATLQRHHHDRDDASVVAIDPLAADNAAEAGGSSAAPTMLAPPPAQGFPARTAGHLPWQACASGWFVSWSSEPLERPPQA